MVSSSEMPVLTRWMRGMPGPGGRAPVSTASTAAWCPPTGGASRRARPVCSYCTRTHSPRPPPRPDTGVSFAATGSTFEVPTYDKLSGGPAARYNERLKVFGILVKARNFLVFQARPPRHLPLRAASRLTSTWL